MVAAPAYLKAHGTPRQAADLSQHACLVYSSVQGDDRWLVTGADGKRAGRCRCTARCARTTCRPCSPPRAPAWAWRSCPGTWRANRWPTAASGRCSTDCTLPTQDIHAVFPSPKLVPGKVSSFIEYLRGALEGSWWERGAELH